MGLSLVIFSKIPFFLQEKANQLLNSLSTAISC